MTPGLRLTAAEPSDTATLPPAGARTDRTAAPAAAASMTSLTGPAAASLTTCASDPATITVPASSSGIVKSIRGSADGQLPACATKTPRLDRQVRDRIGEGVAPSNGIGTSDSRVSRRCAAALLPTSIAAAYRQRGHRNGSTRAQQTLDDRVEDFLRDPLADKVQQVGHADLPRRCRDREPSTACPHRRAARRPMSWADVRAEGSIVCPRVNPLLTPVGQ